jgi:dolichol-phosphate mannosyltransferase
MPASIRLVPLLSVVVPTFNEGINIGPLIGALREELEGVDHEIVVVDDDSSDGTPEKAREAGARVIVRKSDRGLGTAVVEGLRQAKGKYVAVMDGDFQHPPEAVKRMLERAREKNAQVVIGSRYAPGGGENGFTPWRRSMSFGAGLMARVFLPPVRRHRLTDPMSGLFLVRRDHLDLDNLHPKGYKILLEILARNHLQTIEEVGYVFGDRRGGTSKLGMEIILQYTLHVLALAWVDPKNQRVLRFGLVGASGVLVNLGVLYLLHGHYGLHDLLAVVIAIEISIISNFLLNDRFTFGTRRTSNPKILRLLQFNTVSLVALVVNFTAYLLLTRLFGIYYLLAQFIAILVAFTANYLGNLHWTYGEEHRFRLRKAIKKILE